MAHNYQKQKSACSFWGVGIILSTFPTWSLLLLLTLPQRFSLAQALNASLPYSTHPMCFPISYFLDLRYCQGGSRLPSAPLVQPLSCVPQCNSSYPLAILFESLQVTVFKPELVISPTSGPLVLAHSKQHHHLLDPPDTQQYKLSQISSIVMILCNHRSK